MDNLAYADHEPDLGLCFEQFCPYYSNFAYNLEWASDDPKYTDMCIQYDSITLQRKPKDGAEYVSLIRRMLDIIGDAVRPI